MAIPAAFNPHLEVFAEVKRHLLEHGFEYPKDIAVGWTVSEIPKPALFPSGGFRDLDLAEATASFPHNLFLPPLEAYTALLETLHRERAGPRGRPIVRAWSGFARNTECSIEAILTPMRSGYYGLERGQVAVGYHVAEFVYLLHRMHPSIEITQGEGSFYIVLDEGLVGVVNNEVIDAFGNALPLKHEFDVSKLLALRTSSSERMHAHLPMWPGIHNFVIKAGLDSDPGFMQALAHARWALPRNTQWSDSPYSNAGPGRPRLVDSNPLRVRALRVQEACEILKRSPSVPIRSLKPRLVPFAISRQRWSDEVGPLLESTLTRRALVIEYLQNLYEDLMAQA